MTWKEVASRQSRNTEPERRVGPKGEHGINKIQNWRRFGGKSLGQKRENWKARTRLKLNKMCVKKCSILPTEKKRTMSESPIRSSGSSREGAGWGGGGGPEK